MIGWWLLFVGSGVAPTFTAVAPDVLVEPGRDDVIVQVQP